LAEEDKQQLRHIGWEEGQQIPPDFAKRIKAAQNRAQQEADQAHDELVEEGRRRGGRVKVGRELNLSELPPAEQAELRDALATYQSHIKTEQAQRAATAAQEARVVPNADPSVEAAHRASLAAEDQAGLQVTAHYEGPPLPEVEVRMPGTQPPTSSELPPELHPREGAEIAGVENIAPFVTHPGAPQAPAPPPQPQATQSPLDDTTVDVGGTAPVTHCPRCMWDVRQSWVLETTEADKQQFVGAILGGSRFSRAVSVMGGRLQITYRSLTSEETDLCFKQLGIDLRQGRIMDDGQYFMQLQVYRLAMSVERIENGNNECLVEIPPLFDIPYDAPAAGHEETRLVPLVAWFNDAAVPQESLRRIVAQHHRQFQRLVEGLEAMTAEPDFWIGIK
jgi:hypothetical protein